MVKKGADSKSKGAAIGGPVTDSGRDVANKSRKRMRPDSNGDPESRKMPKGISASTDSKQNSLCAAEKVKIVERKGIKRAEEESLAISLTPGVNDPRPNRRLTNFIFHNADGTPRPFEMIQVEDIFISGHILSLEESSEKKKETGIRCEGFGRIETWAISGYGEGSPVIWVSTVIADYDCVKPAGTYKKMYSRFHEKAHACVEVHKRLSKSTGGNPDLTLDELLAAVIRSTSGSKNIPRGASIRDLIISWGEFIYDELIGLPDENFKELPVLAALRYESKKHEAFQPQNNKPSSGVQTTNLWIKNGEESSLLIESTDEVEEDEDMKLARVLQESEKWETMRQKKRPRQFNSFNKFYIKINEAEIANDYPLPAYYKSSAEEIDEYIICDSSIDITDPDQLPHSMLHTWSFYNSDSRLISLELLPMKSCHDIDVTIFGSGVMTHDDGSGFCLDADFNDSSASSSGAQTVDGIPVYLSAVKEWKIEFGSSMVFTSIRTDLGWYRLGNPAKQYVPWYEPVLKTARLSISIIILLKDQTRVSRMTFPDVIKSISEYKKDHAAFISSNVADVERYVVVHGQIILQQFAEYPDASIRKCAFVTGLHQKMEERHHTKLAVKKKAVLEKDLNLNPRGIMEPVISNGKAMPATTTRLINRIWGEYYSKYLVDDVKEEDAHKEQKNEELEEETEENGEEDPEDAEEEEIVANEDLKKLESASKPKKPHFSDYDILWDGEIVGKTCVGQPLYKQAIIRGDVVIVGGFVLVESDDAEECPTICFVEYMFEASDGKKWIHGRLMVRACQTVLGNTANEREIFLTNDCMEFEIEDIVKPVVIERRLLNWGHKCPKDNSNSYRIDKERTEERKSKGLPLEYFCKSLYCPDKGAFFCLPTEFMGLGTGACHSCKTKDSEKDKRLLKFNASMTGFTHQGTQFQIHDYLYVAPCQFEENERDGLMFKGGRNIGLKAYVICQFLEIEVTSVSGHSDAEHVNIKVRRFFRPEDISADQAYCSDIREVFYSDQLVTVPIAVIEGKCEVRRRQDMSLLHCTYTFDHIFFCERIYDPQNRSLKQLPVPIYSLPAEARSFVDAVEQKGKGKLVDGEPDCIDNKQDTDPKNFLATLDIFAGCGGLSEGLQQSGASVTKWAIEYEEPAGQAFSRNHPTTSTVINNCNVILRAIMIACGDEDDCISTSEATDMAAKLDKTEINNFPRPGQVDFINGGPPCQGFSGMNRFNHSTWSKVQCEMILAFLSFTDYFRPKYFLLENVRNFVSFNKGQTFRLTLASLLEMGYQVRFGILEAGAYGVSQSRKRAFIWAASPDEILPEWPEPMHVFAGPELKVKLGKGMHYVAARSTASGAPFRAITVRDIIGDLPAVGNGASKTPMEYVNEPVSWFQKLIRGDMIVLTDHICKEMNELNHIRCQRIPKRPGADWRDLPNDKVHLSTGQQVDLIPWCLPNTAARHNQWKGLFGRLDWEGNFPTSVTDPQPMGKVGLCFHPEQDRILTVRECARSQGFPDSYQFAGNIHHKHRQIGNAVPPPLAFALGRKLKEAMKNKEKLSEVAQCA